MGKCKYTKGTNRLDCINTVLRKINRPLCSECRKRIKLQPRMKPQPKIEELPAVPVETPLEDGPVFNINTDIKI